MGYDPKEHPIKHYGGPARSTFKPPKEPRPHPNATPPKATIPQGTVIEPVNPAPEHHWPEIKTSAKTGTLVRLDGQTVGTVRAGKVHIPSGAGEVADRAHALIREGVLTRLVKGELG